MVRKCLRKCNTCGAEKVIADGSHRIWHPVLKKQVYCGTFRVKRAPVVIKNESE